MTPNLRNSPVMTAKMRNSPVITPNLRILPVMITNMRNLLVIKDDRYMSHIGHRRKDANIVYLSCGEVEVLGYFQLSDMRQDDRNVITEKVSTTALQLYSIATPAQILEHAIEFQRRI